MNVEIGVTTRKKKKKEYTLNKERQKLSGLERHERRPNPFHGTRHRVGITRHCTEDASAVGQTTPPY